MFAKTTEQAVELEASMLGITRKPNESFVALRNAVITHAADPSPYTMRALLMTVAVESGNVEAWMRQTEPKPAEVAVSTPGPKIASTFSATRRTPVYQDGMLIGWKEDSLADDEDDT